MQEQLAPLLHSIARFLRPRRVVELGFGYTTPFLAQALADNVANVASERHESNAQRLGGVLRHAWYEEMDEIAGEAGQGKEGKEGEGEGKEGEEEGKGKEGYAPRLAVVDDSSQRGDGFARAVAEVGACAFLQFSLLLAPPFSSPFFSLPFLFFSPALPSPPPSFLPSPPLPLLLHLAQHNTTRHDTTQTLSSLNLTHLVEMHEEEMGKAHERFGLGTLDLVWNDAQWDPTL